MEVSVAEAARQLGVSVRTVHRMIGDGKLQSRTVGRARRVTIAGEIVTTETPPVTPEAVELAVLRAKVSLLETENDRLWQIVADRKVTRPLLALPSGQWGRGVRTWVREQWIRAGEKIRHTNLR